MEKHRAIPDGYMKVGELAKMANISVRTLQYYDKEGLFSPSAASEGGFRLYSANDVAKLARILLMKQLGFGLADIKKRLPAFETTLGIMGALTEHAAEIRNKIEHLTESLGIVEQMTAEIDQMDKADYKKLFGILVNLQIKNEHYWMVKHFDDETIEHFAQIGMTKERAISLTETTNRLFGEAATLHDEGVLPGSETGQSLAKEFWDMLMEITGGDMVMLQKLNEIAHSNVPDEYKNEYFVTARSFMGSAMEIYTKNLYSNGAFNGSEGDGQHD